LGPNYYGIILISPIAAVPTSGGAQVLSCGQRRQHVSCIDGCDGRHRRELQGGYRLFAAFGMVLLVTSLACGLAGHLGAVRLLYGMGRDNLLPKKVFGHLDAARGNPSYNVVMVGLMAYVGTLIISWSRAVEILNFGALLAFMAVNAVALRRFGFNPNSGNERNFLLDIFVPASGFTFCLVIFLSLQASTLWAGLAWLVIGGAYVVLKTKGFTQQRVAIDFSES